MSDPFATPAPRKFDIAGQSVFLAMPTHRDLHPLTVVSLLTTQEAMQARNIPFTVHVAFGGSIVHHGRSRIAWEFLQSKHNRIFWVDSDITWKPADFLRVLALTTVMDIVGGAYPAKQDPTIFLGRGASNMALNEHGCLPVGGFGMGFCCMTRQVIEDAAKTAPKKRFHQLPEPIPHTFFLPREEADDGLGAEGEDMAFLARAKEQGHQLWIDPSIELGHIGPKTYSGRLLDHLQPVNVEEAPVSAAA